MISLIVPLAAANMLGSSAPGKHAVPPQISYSNQQVIQSGDSKELIAEKAAKVLPRKNQTEWFRMERTVFIHFGPNTFNHVEWGSGKESPAIFNPTELNAEQWVRAIKESGAKMVVLVCKHHDGFCMWPSRYTDHSVASSPWLNGKGSVVRKVADACKKFGVKLGVYLSPADLYQLRTNPTNPSGYYGNGSPVQPTVIPTASESFKSDPSKGRAPFKGFGTFNYNVDDYNRYFLNQLYELLTEYGTIHEVWFDGANPDPSVHETYDYNAWYDLIRKLQPKAVIFGKGPDGRWVGNEWGVGRTTEWSVIPLAKSPEAFNWPDMQDNNLGGRDKLTPGSHLWWFPAEVNVPILYGWFWAPRKPVRTAATLVDIYYQSVGRNGIWLLNLSPDSRGLIPDEQLANLRLASQVIRETFAANLAIGGKLSASSSKVPNTPQLALDRNLDTWWEAGEGIRAADVTLELPKPQMFDVVALQEAVDHRGQRVEAFQLEAWNGAQWQSVQVTEETTTIGFKRLLRLVNPVTTDKLRVRILQSRLEPTLAEIGLFKQASIVPTPKVSNRSSESGEVSLSAENGLPIVYTTDGTIPTKASKVYQSPVPMSNGGTITAASLDAQGRIGMIQTKYFPNPAPIGWKVIAASGVDLAGAAKAIDDNPDSFWIVEGGAAPQSIAIDTGHTRLIGGFTYLPRQDGKQDGLVESYRFETSLDGITWNTVINDGRFDNVRNNPIVQEVRFAPTQARYIRFSGLRETNGKPIMSVAELGILLPSPAH